MGSFASARAAKQAMTMRIDLLGDLGSAPAVLRAVGYAAAERGLAAPAALIGDWFGSGAVIAPTVEVAPVEAANVFDVVPGGSGDAVGGGWFGYLSYPDAAADGCGPRIPQAAGGWSDCVLRQDGDGRWWFESLTDATIPDWVADGLRVPVEPRPFHVTWGEADRDVHRRGVLDCLEAIAAGEVYQACVCTQFRGRLAAGAAPAATSSTATIDFFVDAVRRFSPARAAYLAGRLGRGGVAVSGIVPAPAR